MRPFLAFLIISLALVSSPVQASQEPPPGYDAVTEQLYTELKPLLEKYSFFAFKMGGNSADCFKTIEQIKDYIRAHHPEYSIQEVHTPFNRKNGTFSVTHPSLVIHNRSTGETVALTTDESDGYNSLSVHTLGKNPKEGEIAGQLSYLMGSPVITFHDSVYVNQMLWSLWDQKAPTNPCAGYDGSYGFLAFGDKNNTQIVCATNGHCYMAQSVDDLVKIKGRLGPGIEIKSVGILPPSNAAVTLAAREIAGRYFGKLAKDSVVIAGNLFAGNAVTKLQMQEKLAKGLVAGVKSDYVLYPNAPWRITRPVVYGKYERGGMSLYADSSGEASAQAKLNLKDRFHLLDTATLTAGYDSKYSSMLWNAGGTKRIRNFDVHVSGGQGPSLGNVNLPSSLANPSLDSLKGPESPYVRFGVDYDLSHAKWNPIKMFHRKHRGRKPAQDDSSGR